LATDTEDKVKAVATSASRKGQAAIQALRD
jgi:hypothetical protein